MIVRRLIHPALKLVLTIGLFCLTFLASAQDKGLDVTGSVKEGWKGLEGTKLTLYKNGSVDKSFTTEANGKFKFFFDVNATYMLDVSKAGYVAKKIEFNTTVPGDAPMVWEFDFIVELFQDQSGLNKAIFSNPVAKVHYSPQHNEFDYDLDYSMEFQKQEEEVFEELEKLNEEKSKEEERLRQLAEQQAKDQAKQLAADQKAQQEAELKRVAEEANQRKAAEAEAKRIADEKKTKEEADRVTKAEAEKAKIAEEARLKQEAEQEAKRLADAAKAKAEADQKAKEEAEKAKLVEEARLKLEADQVAKAKVEAELKAKETEYASLIAQANTLAGQESFAEAKANYEQASKLFPERTETKLKLAEIEKSMAKAKQEQERRDLTQKQYDNMMAQAQELADMGKYEAAINLYGTASGINPDSEMPVFKMNELKDKMAAAKEEEEKRIRQEKFDGLMAQARDAEQAKNFIDAKKLFGEASNLIPEIGQPKEKVAELTKLIAKQEEEKRQAQEQRFVLPVCSKTGQLCCSGRKR